MIIDIFVKYFRYINYEIDEMKPLEFKPCNSDSYECSSVEVNFDDYLHDLDEKFIKFYNS